MTVLDGGPRRPAAGLLTKSALSSAVHTTQLTPGLPVLAYNLSQGIASIFNHEPVVILKEVCQAATKISP